MHEHQFTNTDHEKRNFRVPSYPTRCPICKHDGQPEFQIAAGSHRLPGRLIYAVFRCPITNCRGLYIAVYKTVDVTGTNHRAEMQSVNSFQFTEQINFPPNIRQVSQGFCNIYQQAVIAEANDLDQVIGPAYRKSLEFLIKDFLITHKYSGQADQQEQIRRKFLGNVISDDIDEEVIKNCAKRATWLGNDETHYTRKWENKDVNDLKALIKITMSFIDMSIEATRYLSEMPDPSSTKIG